MEASCAWQSVTFIELPPNQTRKKRKVCTKKVTKHTHRHAHAKRKGGGGGELSGPLHLTQAVGQGTAHTPLCFARRDAVKLCAASE